MSTLFVFFFFCWFPYFFVCVSGKEQKTIILFLLSNLEFNDNNNNLIECLLTRVLKREKYCYCVLQGCFSHHVCRCKCILRF